MSHQHFEFFGPHGTVLMFVLLPATLYGLLWSVDLNRPAELNLLNGTVSVRFPAAVHSINNPADLFTLSSFAVTAAWFCFLVLLYFVVPTQPVRGTKLSNGRSLLYRCNGLSSAVVLALTVVFLWSSGLLRLSWAYDHLLQLLTASLVWSFLLATYLFRKSARCADPAVGGNTGYPLYDYFIGRQLNPRDGDFDWKFFCELRPGLLGWVFLVISCAAKQRELHGSVSASMWLVLAFQGYYVFDALLNETSILTTIDIVYDGFGLMLVLGDLAWVPFAYSVQAQFLVSHPDALATWQVAAIVGLQALGLYVFRSANSEKDRFRNNPDDPAVAHLTYLRTASGSRLITSGWWGMSRHPNYLGDWLMSVAWSLPCGFSAPWPYFYPAYFAVLLIHRQLRDDDKCHRKYGKDWERYCELVPYRIVPFVY